LHLNASRIRIAIVLVTLALCAYFSAQGVTSLVAAKWLPAAPPSRVGQTSAGAGKELKGERTPDMRAILARNIFDPTTGALWPPKPVETEQAEGPIDDAPPSLGPGEMPPACDGQARLVSTMYSERLPEWSFASIAVGSQPTLLYRPGKQVDNKTLDSVYPEAVFMKTGNGALCSLVMFRPPIAAGGPRAADATAPPAGGEGAVNPTPNFGGSGIGESDLDQSIKQISETKYAVQRSLIDKVLANQSELMRSARVVPHEENGKVTGVKLYGIRRSSLLGKLGLQNGDLLRTINGFDMASPDSALEAYTKLRSAGNLSVAVVRRGSPMTMDYQIGN
jgi:general secretion pathway protein C